MRVGVISLQHESNTFLRACTTLADFEHGILASGAALLPYYLDAHHEVGGFLESLKRGGVEFVPIFAAWATPGGTVSAACYQELLKRLLAALREAGPLDGLLVAPHGAGVSEDQSDMDGDWLARVRVQVGPAVPIVCTIDPHANLSPAMTAACDVIVAYRTNPHLDQRQRGSEAAGILCRMLRNEVRPTMAATYPRMIIDMASQCTEQSPCLELCEFADSIRQRTGVISVSTVLGFPYADVPDMGTSFIVVTDGDQRLADTLADELAQFLWLRRRAFVADLPTVEVAVSQAIALDGPVCLLDVGDNIGGGSPGDGTLIAHVLVQHGCRSFVCLNDPQAVIAASNAGTSGRLNLAMGGRSDDRHGPPLEAAVRVVRLGDGHFAEPQPRHGGKTDYDMGPTAVVELDFGLTVLLTSRRTPPFSLQQILSCGIDPAEFQVLVAKGVNAPIAAYREACPHILRVNTAGVTTNDVTLLGHEHRRRPMFPFETL